MALFHEATNLSQIGAPEFWDAIVNGLGSVWEEKRPPYKAKSGILVERPTASVDSEPVTYALSGSGDEIISGDGASLTSVTTTPLKFWFSPDFTEHASGQHAGTAEFSGQCAALPGSLQRCAVLIDKFAAFDSGTLDHVTPFFTHVGSKDLKTENRTGPVGTSINCASAAGVAFSSCLIGTTCGSTASVSLSLFVGSATATVTGGNIWRDVNVEHFTCNLASAGGNCTTPSFNGSCPIGTVPNGLGLCCFSST